MLRGRLSGREDDTGCVKIGDGLLEPMKQYGTAFYITSCTSECARIYPMRVWAEIEEKLARVSSHNRAKRKFLTRANYFGQVVELDGQGRVLLPTALRETAEMKGEVDVFGSLNYLEVWNHARVVEDMKKNPFTDDDAKSLEDLGI